MPTIRLTDRWLKSHRAPTREEWTDDLVPGLVVRFGAGPPVFYVRQREGGRVRRTRLGAFPGYKLLKAREEARKLLAARQRLEPSAPRPGSFAELFEAFLRHRRARGEARLDEVERSLRRDVVPVLGSLQCSIIRPRDVAAVLDRIVERGAPVQANRVRSHLARIFRWGMERELVETNPALVLSKPHRERARDRVLSDAEIAALWRALELRHPTLRHLFRFLLLTGLRPSEARLLTWQDVDAHSARVPAERAKSRREHRAPLSGLAHEVLESQRDLGLAGAMVFPSPKAGPKPLELSSLSHMARRLGEELGFSWRPHDLRRTCASGLARLGATREVVRRVLGHADPDVTGRYDRHTYEDEALRALEQWAGHVQAQALSVKRGAALTSAQSRSPATQR